MPSRALPSIAAAAALLAFLPASGQTPAAPATLPPTAPTQLPAPIAATPAVTHGRHAFVTFADGKLDVRADNSSLNVILREIARQTGMTITGGVADQRVFGNYGPADPGTVLATLLDGAGVNLLIKERADRMPAELVLTPRTAGATPPSPSSSMYDEEASAEALSAAPTQPINAAQPPRPAVTSASPASTANTTPVLPPSTSNGVTPTLDPNAAPVPSANAAAPGTTPPASPQPWNSVNGSPANTSPTASTLPTTNSVPTDSLPTPTTAPSTSGIVDAPNPPPPGTTTNPVTPAADGTTTATSPNGVKTPDQVYQQLLELQKARAKMAPDGTTPAPSPPPQ